MRKNIKKIILLIIIISIIISSLYSCKKTNPESIYQEDDYVLVFNKRWRPAKITNVKKYHHSFFFHISYVGYGTKHDEWVTHDRIRKMK